MNQAYLALISTLLLTGFTNLYGAESRRPPQKPNIILIFMDDMGYGDIGPFGSTKSKTPNLDRMAREGMKLTSFYAAPVCTPSRAQVLTGCYAKRVSLPEVIFPKAAIGLNPKENTVAEVMKSSGYSTMCIGKWHVGDQLDFLPTRNGFDHYFGLPYSNDMGGSEEGAKKGKNPPLPLVRDEQVIETIGPAEQDKLTERYTDEAISFIRQNQTKPFFIYMPHTAVHIPIHPRSEFKGHSGNGIYYDWVDEVDWSVGRMMEALRELELAENTLVIFTSDNGPWLGLGEKSGSSGPLRGGKFTTLEGGMREPTIAWWPKMIPPNTTCDAVTGNIDLLPTFAKLGGAELPRNVKIDGRDISPILLGKSKESPREAHFYFSGNRIEAVRSGPWKLSIRNPAGPKGKPNSQESTTPPVLYHLDNDIGEKTDVAAQNPDVVMRLQHFIDQMDADLGKKQLGPGVRPAGRVKKPVGLFLPGHEPKPVTESAH